MNAGSGTRNQAAPLFRGLFVLFNVAGRSRHILVPFLSIKQNTFRLRFSWDPNGPLVLSVPSVSIFKLAMMNSPRHAVKKETFSECLPHVTFLCQWSWLCVKRNILYSWSVGSKCLTSNSVRTKIKWRGGRQRK